MERLSNLSKVTQIVSDRARIQNETVCFQSPRFLNALLPFFHILGLNFLKLNVLAHKFNWSDDMRWAEISAC